MSKKRNAVPKVGVALLAYNQGKYVDEAIESLKKQTFQDFEVYLIDDGSNDGFTPKKLASIEYDKISRKCLHKENIGGPKRRKQYDLAMKNEYVINFCGDDVLDPVFFEKTVSFLDKNPSYGAVCTNLRIFREDYKKFFYERKYNKNTMKFPEMLVSCNMLGSSLIRRRALDKLNLDWPLDRYYDWNRWNAMLKSGWKLGLVPEPLFYYRQLDNSLSHTGNKKTEMEFRRETMNRYAEEFQKYSIEIIKELFEYQAELQEGKDWLDKQYHLLTEENDDLKKRIRDFDELLKEENRQIENSIIVRLWKRLRRK